MHRIQKNSAAVLQKMRLHVLRAEREHFLLSMQGSQKETGIPKILPGAPGKWMTIGGNMKRISRAKLRGKPLDPDCKKANTTTNEYGLEDKRVYCFGIWEAMTEEPIEMCNICGAFFRNSTPLKISDISL